MEEIRDEINKVDREMALLFEKRMDLVCRIAEYKFINNEEIFDHEREKEVIEKNINTIQNENYKRLYNVFLQMIMDQSKEVQRDYIKKMKREKN
ncbi:MAG: chorismate mutase [Eubacterium sp.]